MGANHHNELKESLEELVDRQDGLRDSDGEIHQIYYRARTLASDLGHDKVETQIRNHNFEQALVSLTETELVK